MPNLTVFDFDSHSVRVFLIDDKIWIIALDVCRVLNIKNTSQALQLLDTDEILELDVALMKSICLTYDLGTTRLLAISESGFYNLVLRSRKPQAKPFQQWVTKEVLPSIRKTGMYESEKAKLEAQFQLKAAIKEIREAYQLYKEAYGDCYAYRYLHQQMSKHQPHLAGDEPEINERPSLPSAKSWLTPTQLAAELGFNYKTGNPNPQAINSLLEKLGYQNELLRPASRGRSI